jgi:hypothetical protein
MLTHYETNFVCTHIRTEDDQMIGLFFLIQILILLGAAAWFVHKKIQANRRLRSHLDP